jgi:Fe-S cluster assembly scaffold protein SufB
MPNLQPTKSTLEIKRRPLDLANNTILNELLDSTGFDHSFLDDTSVAHLIVHHNKVLRSHLIDGLDFDIEELANGILGKLTVKEDVIISKPVQICFGTLAKEGTQRIVLDVNIQRKARVSILAHCIFPNAVNFQHMMDASIHVGEKAVYDYYEKHVHSTYGGLKVFPKAVVSVEEGGRFKTEFELLKGRVGKLVIDYITRCKRNAVMEMNTRIYGQEDDVILIKETGHLLGDYSRGVLTSRIALRDNAKAEIRNRLVASAAYARGHVDCKEIIQDNAKASAIPIVEVNDPKAHVTHEAAIGSVDNKQLETLMSRGLHQDEAIDLIISGLLRQ